MGWPAVYLLIYLFIFAEHGLFTLVSEKKPICIFICIRSVMSFVLLAFRHPESASHQSPYKAVFIVTLLRISCLLSQILNQLTNLTPGAVRPILNIFTKLGKGFSTCYVNTKTYH